MAAESIAEVIWRTVGESTVFARILIGCIEATFIAMELRETVKPNTNESTYLIKEMISFTTLSVTWTLGHHITPYKYHKSI